ncbi:class IIb bacteriocin, lactobin A/cerein 7B family [Streptococcus suis]|uniref:class IIb bacteriocin, lactobin A/cerein 7B family n=1 Tax=Streptococcus suis TaxID=1307 RepID=UPI000CF5A504|nr:class IIb bacteriocin, lactobin A/cerein 7B family [Streptococcus suis]AWL27085.1 class IIb bacteriocin, lactobin A/cerein 7B family [Streptococcus suis]MBO3643347.1 class IIb bacteriocin, lactobin A/cerein 7B family [Streptococcus suis]MCO8180084.1 class IIb bacteriocin, lactobin A/cerein 7B family [Streptococcus suis]NQK50422.1 class IIb bacteriocin, lactobin A/cerein 7B family [Streptococcus suis]NQM14680.1 class IIb bacteriocin, lactobin A/cerein 7B family [Streptococcus suis]
MTKFETMDNMNVDFVALSDQELMDMEGGAFLTATIAGVAVWKILGGAGLVAAGGAAGYFINK